ncbi:RIP metalloprotease RseP [Vallitalea okinawensis]|uniref:RIP metalloprotease RseP n=1 Tax=Vallitalea okinawensis TaxID=2078660 RepID=UPI000CFB58DC|nr:RIP metalloprotease RseP [Vallitalea okinawensis]
MVRINIIVALIVFGILVLVHEFGHFIVAKKNGIFVEEFAIGMGPKILSFKKGETEYSLRVLPLGGFCKMLGEEEESHDERSFSQKSVGARMAVIAAGPFMNFLLAFSILFIFAISSGYISNTVDTIEDGKPAQEAGLLPGDVIKEIDGDKVHIFEDLTFYLQQSNGEAFDLVLQRDGEEIEMRITPFYDEDLKTYRIGIAPKVEEGNFFGAVSQGFWKMIFYIKVTIVGLFQLVSGQVSADQVAGPIGIINIIGDSYEQGLQQSILAALANLAQITVLLSANLGVLNLLPIPALDGSHLVFLSIEAIRRKPMNATIQNTVNLVGFALLMLLMVVVAYNDIVRIWLTK